MRGIKADKGRHGTLYLRSVSDVLQKLAALCEEEVRIFCWKRIDVFSQRFFSKTTHRVV